jgi:SpoVK/Ycf46/Vps4 family AAA+-type ATPase
MPVESIWKSLTEKFKKQPASLISSAQTLAGVDQTYQPPAPPVSGQPRPLPPGSLQAGRTPFRDVPIDRERGLPLVQIERPAFGWDKVVLPEKCVNKLKAIIEEFRNREKFRLFGISPRRKLFFVGPEGCGKKTTSRIIASELEIPLLKVRLDALISTTLSSTVANLRKVCDFSQKSECVVYLEGLETLARPVDWKSCAVDRAGLHYGLCQFLDSLSDSTLFIGASSKPETVDRSIWLKFDDVDKFELPGASDRKRLILLFCNSFPINENDILRLTRRLRGLAGAEIEQICKDIMRQAVIQSRNRIIESDIDIVWDRFKQRLKLMKNCLPPETIQAQELTAKIEDETHSQQTDATQPIQPDLTQELPLPPAEI